MHPQLLTPTLPSGLSFDLLLIEEGQFRMGSPENDPDALWTRLDAGDRPAFAQVHALAAQPI